MIITRPEGTTDFEKTASGEITFYADAKLDIVNNYAKPGDYLALNEYDGKDTGRCVLMEVSAVVEEVDCYIYALQPCRIEPHRRLTAAVYGEKKEGGSDDI